MDNAFTIACPSCYDRLLAIDSAQVYEYLIQSEALLDFSSTKKIKEIKKYCVIFSSRESSERHVTRVFVHVVVSLLPCFLLPLSGVVVGRQLLEALVTFVSVCSFVWWKTPADAVGPSAQWNINTKQSKAWMKPIRIYVSGVHMFMFFSALQLHPSRPVPQHPMYLNESTRLFLIWKWPHRTLEIVNYEELILFHARCIFIWSISLTPLALIAEQLCYADLCAYAISCGMWRWKINCQLPRRLCWWSHKWI